LMRDDDDVFWGGSFPALYSPGGKVTDLKSNPSQLQLLYT
jgi:hypothetical protein